MAAAPQPKEAEEVAAWKASVDYAKQVEQYADYALYRAALESRDPKVTIDLGEALRQRNPDRRVRRQGRRSRCSWPTGRRATTPRRWRWPRRRWPAARRNEDMLLVLADSYLQQKKEPEKVHTLLGEDRAS